jgi:hypothetical protein
MTGVSAIMAGYGVSVPPVTPISIVSQAYICQTVALGGGTPVGGVLGFSGPFYQGDYFIIAYSDDSGVQPQWQDNPDDGAISGAFIIGQFGAWHIAIYSCQNAPQTTGAIAVDASGANYAYCYIAGWQLRNVDTFPSTPPVSVVATSPAVGTTQAFSVTTTASNSCVLGVAYSTPLPTSTTLLQMNTFTLPVGWNSILSQNENGDPAFYRISKANIPTAGTISVSASPTDGVNTNVLRIEILKG